MRALQWIDLTASEDVVSPHPSPCSSEDASVDHQSLSGMSQRLVRHFQAAEFSDCTFIVASSFTEVPQQVPCHRVVIQRNSFLNIDFDDDSQSFAAPPGVTVKGLQGVLYAHYLESPSSNDAAAPYLERLAACLPVEEWQQLELMFGPLQADRWRSLSDTLNEDLHLRDCQLCLGDGSHIDAHRIVLAGVDGDDYFSRAFHWPGSGETLQVPPDIEEPILCSLLSLRYGATTVALDSVLECRHFADFFGWQDTVTVIDCLLEAQLTKQGVDVDSAIAIFGYCAEAACARTLPSTLKEQAYLVSLRWFLSASEEAQNLLPAMTRSRLRLLSQIRNHFGHICNDIKEYLHAAEDDLIEWQRMVGPHTSISAKMALANQWEHWKSAVSEYGRLEGEPRAAKAWEERVQARRAATCPEKPLFGGA